MHKALHGGLAAGVATATARMDHLKGPERQKHIVGAASGAMMAEVVSEYMMGAAIRRMEEKLTASGHAPSSQAYADLRRSLLADEFKTIRTVAQLSVVALAESLKVDLNAAMNAATNALDHNSSEVFFELAQQSGSGNFHQDDDGYDTDEEADQQAYGRHRKNLLDAVQPEVVEKYGQAAAEYAHHLSLGPDGYAQAMLEKNTDGREISPEVRQILMESYQEHYFDMLHAFNVMQGMGKIGDTAGEATEYILRKAGVNRATARNVHRAMNDGAAVFGLGGAIKGTAKFGARTVSKAGKGTTRISLDGLGLENYGKIKPNYFEPGSEFSLRIDPRTGHGPMSVDSNAFTSAKSYTAAGAKRNAKQFWKMWNQNYPTTLSEKNFSRIFNGGKPLSPKVDDVWVRSFPEHSRYIDEILVHHHIDHGSLVTPLPESVHAKQPGRNLFHSKTGGKKK